jgi:hypothetical protein
MIMAYIAKTKEEVEAQAEALTFDMMEERINRWMVNMENELPEPQPIISIDGCCVCSRGNISAICGEAKSKKTFLTSALVASAMAVPSKKINNFKAVDNNMDLRVLWVDTEQGEVHVRRVIDRISRMTGASSLGGMYEPRLFTLQLREMAPLERYNLVLDTIEHYSKILPFDLVVIDGVADLQRNTNDLEESDKLVGALMAISTHYNIHIMCVLHTNPGSDKARGHLGSSLQRKAESVIYVHRNGDCSVVEPQFCRNEPFERFSFSISEDGIPELCDMPASEDMSVKGKIVWLLNNEYGGCVERATLSRKITETMNVTSATACMRIKRLVNKGALFEDGNLIRTTPPGNGVINTLTF